MAPGFGWSESYSSPTLLARPQHPPGFTFAHRMDASAHMSQRARRARASPLLPDVAWAVASKEESALAPTAGRKRSRDELSDGDDSSRSSTAPFPSTRPSPSPPKGEPVYGPGMTLVYPDDPAGAAGAIDAASQTGTWAEELAERLRSSSFADAKGCARQGPESRKSVRLNRDAPGLDDVAAVAMTDVIRNVEEPAIDEATLTLGIGWATLPSNTTMDAACRGWARFIEANFPLTSAKVVWQNRSMPAYLVSAVASEPEPEPAHPGPVPGAGAGPSAAHWRVGAHGYYLFDEELRQGRFVARSWERALDNLRCAPVAFDGEAVLTADPRARALDFDDAGLADGMDLD